MDNKMEVAIVEGRDLSSSEETRRRKMEEAREAMEETIKMMAPTLHPLALTPLLQILTLLHLVIATLLHPPVMALLLQLMELHLTMENEQKETVLKTDNLSYFENKTSLYSF